MSQEFNNDPELDELVRRLNRSARDEPHSQEENDSEPEPAGLSLGPLPSPDDDAARLLREYLAEARRRDASDLLIASGSAPMARINGGLMPLGAPLGEIESRALCGELTPRERRHQVAETGAVDFSFSAGGLGRFRCNVHRERGNWAASIRLLPTVPPDFEQLHLPPTLPILAELEHGLVLVTGPTGCGKTTTLASILRRILERRRVHVITIEDPVEYEHRSESSVVEHIEVGRDALSFPQALRAALRQDPDVLLVGEMRDRESISMAVTAAETGHLVFSTLHTGDVVQSVSRILDSYPAAQIETVRSQLSISLAAVVSQMLVPRVDGRGRIPAVETLFVTDAVRNLIRLGNTGQLRAQMEMERGAGSLTMDHALAKLVREGSIDKREARLRSRNPGMFDSLIRQEKNGSA
jgi:twitching motility protein PilT